MRALAFFISLALIPITLVFAFLGVLGMSASCLSPASHTFPAFCGLLLPAILVANLILCIYWILQRKWWVLVPIMAILINFNYFLSIFQFNECKESENGTPAVKIASYNVGGFRSWARTATQDDISAFIKDNNVSVFCLQEYKEIPQITPDSLGKLLNLPYHAIFYLNQTHYANYGVAIFSAYPVVDWQGISFGSETNGAMWVDLKIGQDTVRVFNCHLQTTYFNQQQKNYQKSSIGKWQFLENIYQSLGENFKQRSRQAAMIRQMADSSRYPLIVCGDFNDTPQSYAYHTVKGRLSDGFRTNGHGYGYTFRGIHHLLRIDFILYDPRFKGLCYNSPQLEWSDHNPVLMELSL